MTIEYFIKNWTNIKEEDISFTEDEWKEISAYKHLSEEFIEKYKDKVNWNYISIYQILSEGFIEKHEHEVDWDYISGCQSLSEDFIEKYKGKVEWHWISKYHSLSWDFILKHQNRIQHPDSLKKYFRIKYSNYYETFSIHANNNYGIIISWENRMNIQTIPSNIIFCQSL